MEYTSQIVPNGIDLLEKYEVYPHQEKLHLSSATYLAAWGGAGGGKSQFLLWHAIINYVLRYPGCEVLLLRRKWRELEQGLINDLLTCVPNPDGKGQQYGAKGKLFVYNYSNHTATFFNGSKIWFGHCQNDSEKDLQQYLSSSFCFIGIDEGGQFSFYAWDFLKMRNRKNPGCKPDMNGNFPACQMAVGSNPLGIGWIWIKCIFIDKQPFIKPAGVVKDNNGRWWVQEAGNWKLVHNPDDYCESYSNIFSNPVKMREDPTYVKKLMDISDPVLRAKALDGDPNVISGQYYSNFSQTDHVINLRRDPQAIKWQDWQPRWIGWDFGIGHHSAIYFFTRALIQMIDNTYKPGVICYREIVVNNTSSAKLVKMIYDSLSKEVIDGKLVATEKIQHIFFSHEKFNRVIDSDHTPADDITRECRKYGLPPVSRASNDRIAGAVLIYNLLDKGDLAILDTCPDIITALPNLMRNETNLEDVKKMETKEDDCFDGFKYGLLTMLNEKKKPQDAVIREKAEAIEDKSQRFMYLYKQVLNKDKDQGIVKENIVPSWMKR